MNEPIIDPAPLEAIRSLEAAGSEGLLGTIIGLFLEQSVELGGKITDAVSASDASSLREAAHSLKSSSANVGAMRVSSLCYDLEMAGREGTIDRAAPLVDRLALAVGEANAALKEISGATA
jgi:two-component system sensor histidine kinase/response regulator